MSSNIDKQHELFTRFANLTIQLNMLSSIVQNPVECISEVLSSEDITSFELRMDLISNDVVKLKNDVVKHIESSKTLHS